MSVIRSLECDRNTIHKHLVFCLMVAQIVLVTGLQQTQPPVSGVLTCHGSTMHSVLCTACFPQTHLAIWIPKPWERESLHQIWFKEGALSVSVCLSLSVSMSLSVSLCVSVSVCVSVCLSLSLSLSLCLPFVLRWPCVVGRILKSNYYPSLSLVSFPHPVLFLVCSLMTVFISLHWHPCLWQVLCSIIAGVLHFFFLASFAWMCLEGVQLYVMLIEVFESERSRVLWYYLFGYGVPTLIVAISAGVFPRGYGTKFQWVCLCVCDSEESNRGLVLFQELNFCLAKGVQPCNCLSRSWQQLFPLDHLWHLFITHYGE